MARPPGYTDPRYLEAIGEYLRPIKQRTYAAMHIELGHHVLDAGCGTGIDTLSLARLVGPMGRVVGVDFDAELIEVAVARAERAAIDGWVEHLYTEVTALPFDEGTFHSTRCDRLFQVIPEPEAAFAEMVRVTRPGGWVVALDTDWGTISADTEEVDIERRLLRVQADLIRPNGYIGRRLYGLFKREGLSDVTVEVLPSAITDYATGRIGIGMDELERRALEVGAITEEELERIRRSFEKADADGAFFASVSMMLVAGRKGLA